MLQNLHIRWNVQLVLVGLTFTIALIYILYKAINLSFTHDESYTYLHYVHQSFMDIISYKTPYTNNHILNTVLIKYFESLFGSSELVLRFPNVLAFILYSIFSVLLVKDFCPKLMFPFYVLLTVHPYLLEFFALARGYGLSIGFLMMSIYFANRYLNNLGARNLVGFNTGAFLAVMSNFSLLNYYGAALIGLNVYLYFLNRDARLDYKQSFWKMNKINLVSLLISGMVLYEPLRRLSKIGLLDFGGKSGFIADTIGSSIDDFFYEMTPPIFVTVMIKSCIILILAVLFIFLIIRLLKSDWLFLKHHAFAMFINLTAFTIVLFSYLQHVFLGNDFYVHRFALFLYPIVMLNIFAFIRFFRSYPKLQIIVTYIVVLGMTLNFYSNYNLKYFKDWKYDKDTKEAMMRLVADNSHRSDYSVQLGINWLFEPTTNFYRYTWNLKWLLPTHRKGITGFEDYWYLFNNDPEFRSLEPNPTLFKNNETAVVLLKRVAPENPG